MPTGELRIPWLLLIAGYLGVVAGTVALAVTYGGTLYHPGAWLIYLFAPPIGYGLVGVAWWQLAPVADAGAGTKKSMRLASRTLAAATLITSLTYFALFESFVHFLYSLPRYENNLYWRHERLELAAYAALGVGFVLAAVGFWMASNVTTERPDPAPDVLDTVEALS
jgi:nitrate/nitrite transporter NarK